MKSRKGYALLSGLVIFTVLLNLGCVGEECGDDVCNPDIEDCVTCSQDCGVCTATEALCNDGIDNDNDGFIDCADTNCALQADCLDMEINCDDGIDNDGDNMIDCADADCVSTYVCQQAEREMICDDGVDNDNDGFADCIDSDCVADNACILSNPDLEIKEITLQRELVAEAPGKITAEIYNNGVSTSKTYNVRMYYWYPESMSNDLVIGSTNFVGLESETSKLFSVIWTPPEIGAIKLRAVVDVLDVIDENDREDNNELVEEYTVKQASILCKYVINESDRVTIMPYRGVEGFTYIKESICDIIPDTSVSGRVDGYTPLISGDGQYTLINGEVVYFKDISIGSGFQYYTPVFLFGGKSGVEVEGSQVFIGETSNFEYGDTKCSAVIKSTGQLWVNDAETCSIPLASKMRGTPDGDALVMYNDNYAILEEKPIYVDSIETRDYGTVEEKVIVIKQDGTKTEKILVPGNQRRAIFEFNGDVIISDWLEKGEIAVLAHS
jgi:hypothetical protein